MRSQVVGACHTTAVGHTHPPFHWIVRHSGWLMTRYLVKATGMTAYAAVCGEEYRKEIAPFGETIMNKIPVARTGARPLGCVRFGLDAARSPTSALQAQLLAW